uniref:PuwF-G n=1 Tax=Cylindrospermum alatosporum CCALA 994 TaxID=1382619 RepID=A0A346GB36_9NOST|nr:PuwF-G [Cylindrospermum alatosporum CCALA 994]
MKPIQEFLSELGNLNIKLSVEGGVKLRCNAPSGTLTPEIRTQLSDRKAEIITFLQQVNLDADDLLDSIPVVPRDGILPLSSTQQRLWFLDQMEGASATYNMPAAMQMHGILQIEVLERSLAEIIRRHEVLRTSFQQVNGKSAQVIDPNATIILPVVDLQGLSPDKQANEVKRLVIQEAEKPFDLKQAPLLRVTLLRLGEESHVLLLNMHHIVSDGWSIGIFIQELSALYSAYCEGKPSPLAELPIQYADFAQWQQQWLKGDDLANKLKYWKQQLADAPPLLELPTDRPRPAIQTFRGSSREFLLPLELTEKLKRLSQQSGVTLFMTLEAAFVSLLHRYSGQEDILIGTPIANRNHREIESLIGFFVNTLVLRTNLAGNPSFAELLKQVRQVALDAYTHQDVPFEQVVETLQPARNLSHTPLFQVMFILQNAPMGELELPGLRLKPLPIEAVTSKFDLTLSMEETPQGLLGNWEYSTDLFDGETISRMAGHFQNLLTAVVANTAEHIQQLPLLSDSERQQLLVDWNSTTVDYSTNLCLHQWFEQQVQQTPDDVAVVLDNTNLTYSQLNNRANQLAHYLQTLGVAPDVLVGICVERSLDMVVGILGILKAGGAYVPLDPEYPQERLEFMLDDSQVSVLLTQSQCLKSLPEVQAQIIPLDTDWGIIETQSQENPVSDVSPNNLAYIIYTSGSTGKPKGVLVNHKNVTRLLGATQHWFNFNQSDVWTLFHSYAFDFSVWEIWGALLYGGRLVVVPFWVSRDSKAFYNLLCVEKVTVLNQTPSAFRQLIWVEEQEERATSNLNLRWVVFGGEALDPSSLIPWFKRHGDSIPQLVNMYGITETTVHVTYRPISIADTESRSSVIGAAIPDLQMYILDEQLQPVPIGVRGQMYVGGAGVTRGYLNRPELTAERFIKNPFRDDSGERLYKTGDLARSKPDGSIEYLGRIDNQVKLRGFRIELGEIESAIAQHPLIRETVVLVREDIPGDKRLVAYFVSNAEAPTSSGMRDYLKQQLPDYMIPAVFVGLDSFPLTANGKLDVRALPIPEQSKPEETYIPPSTPEQALLAGVWAEVLGAEKVGINDNYFELGGDSIRSIQIRAKANQVGLDFSLQQLFQYQTIAELASVVSSDISISPISKTAPFSLISEIDQLKLPEDVEDAYPLATLQAGMIFHSEYNENSPIYHDVFTFHLCAALDLERFHAAIQQIIARHAVLRTSIALTGYEQPLQLVHQTVETPLQVEDISLMSTDQQETVIDAWMEAEKNRHFDWKIPPLLRFHIHRRSEETFNLSFSFHHAILDGWSVASLLTELLQKYFSLMGQEVVLQPSPNLAFADFIALEQTTLESQSIQQYWTEQLSDLNVISLPRLPESKSAAKGQLGVQEVPISPEVSAGLKQLAQNAGVPIKSVLLAAHLRVLSLLSNQTDVLTGLVSNGRPENADGERVLGLFLNTLPLRLHLNGGTWLDLIRETFQAEQGMLPNRRYPLAELQKMCGGKSLFETNFNFVHFHVYQSILGLEGLEVLGHKVFEQTNFTLVANFSLDLISSQINCILNYDANELGEEQIKAIGSYYGKTLEAMVSQPDERYEMRSLLSDSERHTILVEWNQTSSDYPAVCLHQLFEQQVQRTPDAVAVVFADQHLTYSQLNNRANQLAHHLQSLGVAPDVLVGICVERSLEMLVGLLGIMKAGGAYVPIDPAYPQERLRYMLGDAQVSMLLTQSHLLDILPEENPILCLDTDWQIIAHQSSENVVSQVQPQNLAYIIYTSGSTGQPKGAMIQHQGVVNYLSWCTQAYAIANGSGAPVQSSFAFDATITSIFSPLIVGGQVVMLPEKQEIEALCDVLRGRHQFSLVKLTPAHLELLNQLLLPEELPESSQALVIGGEALLGKTLQFWQQYAPNTRLINEYGPTETVVGCCIYEVMPETSLTEKVLIGRPIANTQLYILDQFLQPVPIGVGGELYIGGAGVARGYLNRPELTQEKFIANPFSNLPEARLYKTGDLARYLPDGNIEYLGRIDNQVKLRGFRIELGEIENAIAQHPQVRETAVLLREDIPGDKRLIAYFVADTETPTSSDLRDYLKKRLPDYMIPAGFVELETFPLTNNGKIDRRTLPAPDLETSSSNLVSPRTPTEEIIANIISEVLRVKHLSIYDNFFEIGGNSLLATQVITRLRETFQIELPLRYLFESPTVAELDTVITTLRQTASGLITPEITAINRENQPLSLSWAQQRLWFIDQLEGASAVYNMPAAVQMEGILDVVALEQTLAEIVRRHEVLRTSFHQLNGTSVQVISAEATINLPVVDLQGESTTEVQRLITLTAEKPFDLKQAPLLRVTLLRLGEESHVLLLNMHHIVSDGWSIGIFIQELSALYSAYCEGKLSPLTELPIQYADFAQWQQQWLKGDDLANKLKYWKQQLADAPPLLELPTDRPRPAIQTFRGSSREFLLPLELTEKLKRLSQQSGVTLFMTLEAAFVSLLHRYSGQEDILIGTPIANRNHREIESLIGFFVNTLVLRTNLAGNPSFAELLKQVRQVALDAYTHQDVPFEQVVETLQPARNLSHTPLFQVMFILQNAPMGELELPGLRLKPLPIEAVTSKFDLTLSMEETPQGLLGNWEYSTDLFDGETISRMAGHFQNLLTAVVANTAEHIQQLPLLSDSERQQLLVDWNSTTVDYSTNLCLHQWFEQQVQQTPDAVAVVFDNTNLTYSQLNNRANQLAHYLQTLGVAPDVLVGICVERSLDMVVGILGILKAGGAYVPLDPEYPQERLDYMLRDSQVSVLLTQSQCLKSLPEVQSQIIPLDTDWGIIETQSQENPVSDVSPNNLAYIIYTSGSTGKPKGVLVNHKNVTRLLGATQHWFNFNQSDVWTLFHSYAFDFSVWEIWGALLYGGRLVVVPFWVSRDSKAFYNLLCVEKVTVLNQTPSAFRQLIWVEEQEERATSNLNLRWVVFGGEALDPSSLIPWFKRHGDSIPQLVNMYGITETTVHVTYRPISIADTESRSSVIGAAIPDLQMYILDEQLQPVPIGVRGQMYVGGAGVTRGYLNRPELTAERFIKNPFRDDSGERLYKTGDLARSKPDGSIEYLGRIDNQVKLRGFRIELGEIESAIAQHPLIRETVVLVREDIPGDKRLVAYFVSNAEAPTSSGMRDYLKQQLPDYMIPAVFVGLDSFPLTANGKLDVRALPIPEQSKLEETYIPPSTPEQALLAGVWAEVLGAEKVGINDNYFELGGDSIRSIQIRAKANQVGLDFSLQQLFQYQTIAELASVVSSQPNIFPIPSSKPFSLISEIDQLKLPEDVEDAYPLATLQAGMIFHSEYSIETAIYHDVFSFHLRATLDIAKFKDAIQQVVNRYAVLRTSFALTGYEQPLQLVHQTVEAPLQVEDISHLDISAQKAVIDDWITAEKHRHFDWKIAPMLRFQIHRRSRETFSLSFSFHHAILDGWSVASLLTELWQQYISLLGQTVALQPAPTTTFRDFVALEQTALQSQDSQQYWTEQLQDFNVTKLPRLPESARTGESEKPGEREVLISPELSEGLKQLARKAGVPIKTVLLAAHLRVLGLVSNQTDVLTGLVSNGRPENVDGERALGLFLNTLPFRLHLNGGTWLDLIGATFQAEQANMTHRRYPLAEMQRMCGGQSLFETNFNFTHFHVYQGILGLDGLEFIEHTLFEQTNFALVANFSLDVSSSDVRLILSYDANELGEEQIKAIGSYYGKTLEAMVSQPDERYEMRSLLSDSERHQLIVEWNQTASEYPAVCLHQLFEQQVQRTPDAIAVVFADQHLTYSQLNNRANQLARHLQSLGVAPDVLVGICVERSLEMLVGLLGILKAGGAYVPLDPAYPQERLRYMLGDAQVSMLLTQSHLLDILPEENPILCLDTDWQIIAHQSSENVVSQVQPQNLAYIIYTSGSTGQPKGAMIQHQGVVNYLSWCTQAYAIANGSGAPVQSSFAFDATITSIFSPLIVGGQVVMLPEKQEIEALCDVLRGRHQFSLVKLTPAHLELLNQLLLPEELPESSQALVIGGEALLGKTLQFWQQYAPNTRLINEYGPTETVVGCCIYEVMPETSLTEKVWIGRPIANTQLYILDQFLQPVPIGVGGELYIGGAGVARGYLNRPELTQEKFIANPFSKNREARLYKTGDLARYLPDGNIEYLGRIDNQIKLRGFRIELGEIENAIAQHPQVRETAVLLREDIPGDKRLIAYFVADTETPTSSDLRDYLKKRLPDYMIPAGFVELETFPLTNNGKIDRRALPAPDLETSSSNLVSPRTPTEEIIANIISEVLRVKHLSIYDNFFEIGGNSLLATQVITRLRETFQIELPLRYLFESPTVAELDAAITTFRQTASGLSTPALVPAKRENQPLSLSWAQQRLWFIDQLEGASAVYNIPATVQMDGVLDVVALEQTLAEIVRRHEVLRTSFHQLNGTSVQVISAEATINLPVVDLQKLPPEEQANEVQQLAVLAAETPFDLKQAPLLRVTLLRLSEQSHVLLLNMHHIVSDGWSIGVFIQELSALYQAYCEGKPSPLGELAIQYADFAQWQQQWLRGEVLDIKLKYWKQQLADAPPLLELPTDRPRPAIQTFRGSSREFLLPLELTEKLKRLSQQSGVTLFMTLEAAFVSLLHRYSGQEDILIGTPIANRNHREIESLIGFFVNTLVLRTNLAGNPSFAELLKQVRQVALDAYTHQDVPFEQVVEALQPARNLSHTPLFQVMFILQNAPMGDLELPGLHLTSLSMGAVTSKFDLTLSMEETPQGLLGNWEYSTDLFDGETINRMAGHFQNLLTAVVANPAESIQQLPLLSNLERQQLLVDWNSTTVDYQTNLCLHQWFEQQVQQTPDAVAVVFDNTNLTYSQLNNRANQLAHYLQTLGVAPDVLVGICVERSLDMVVGILGILKAGGAYVPLDPEYPQERLDYMLRDSQVSVLLTQSQCLKSLPEVQSQIIPLDTDWGIIETQSQENPVSEVAPNNLAYIIYTSGSTGKPKGVAIAHCSPVALVAWALKVFTPQQLAGVLASTSLCFDLSIFEMFVPLSCGGMVIVAENALHLPELIAFEQVTLINTVPSAIRELLNGPGLPQSLATVNLAGEPLPLSLVQQLYQRQTIHQVFNLYGPSETTTYSTFALCNRGDSLAPTIGRAIANTQIYILDALMQPVPIGVRGELYIGGAGVARGYLNRPELTAEKFIPNSFNHSKFHRLYKTGDLARYLPDGNIEYLGRIDNQVKLRGFRIELGEIETAIALHPQLKQAVVSIREDQPNIRRLVAYLVAEGETPSSSELRSFLKQQLPDYMVPGIFVFLDALPLTPNGKVDRRALPAPNLEQNRPIGLVPASTAIEESLVTIWSEILGLKQVSIHDNFFDLGGDSIISIQIIARAAQVGIQLTLKQIFQCQTIAELATVCGTSTIQAEQGLVTGEVPLTPIQQWFLEQNSPHPDYFNQSVLLEVTSDLKPELLPQVVQHLLEQHDALRLRFGRNDSQWQQINSDTSDIVPFQVVDLSALAHEAQQAAIETTAAQLQASLNLSEGPLMRVALFKLGNSSLDQLLIIIHHLAVDGVSWRILLADLSTAYQQISRGEAIKLPLKTTSFKDWAIRLQQYGRSPSLAAELDYWLASSRAEVAPLPVDYADGKESNTVGNTAQVSVSLSESLTHALLQEVPQVYNTQINDVLLTALLQSFAVWTGANSVLVDLEGHGREEIFEEINLSRTVGWFTTIYPLLLELGEENQPGAALKWVKEQLRTVPQRGIGYGVLRYLSGDRTIRQELQALPQAEVCFNYLGQFDHLQTEGIIQGFSQASSGATQSPLSHRRYLLEVNGLVAEGKLQLNWTYSKVVHERRTIERLADEFITVLQGLIIHCQSPEAGGFTPSDFPIAELSQADLDELLAEIN